MSCTLLGGLLYLPPQDPEPLQVRIEYTAERSDESIYVGKPPEKQDK
jgi:hypothetical protein